MEEMVIAVDPGREKCGIAIVHSTQGARYQKVIETLALTEKIANLAIAYSVYTVVLGNKTSSRAALEALNTIIINGHKLNIVTVDEHLSTDEARKRYWQANPPKGLKRLIPVTLQVPPVPVDDYVAVILAERYFKKSEKIICPKKE